MKTHVIAYSVLLMLGLSGMMPLQGATITETKSQPTYGASFPPPVCYDLDQMPNKNARSAGSVEPFEIMDGLYYVGNTTVSCHLLTSDNGLILIDSTFPHTVPMLLSSISKLGFNPSDVKVVIGTHAAIDHTGGEWYFQQAFGAQAWIPEDDVEGEMGINAALCIDGAKVDLSGIEVAKAYPPFQPDRLIRDGETITWGGRTFTFHHTPMATPGTMTIEFPLRAPSGEIMKAGIIGGIANRVGGSAMTIEELREMKDIKIWLAVHPQQNQTFEKASRLNAGESPNPFIDPVGWSRFVDRICGMMAVEDTPETHHPAARDRRREAHGERGSALPTPDHANVKYGPYERNVFDLWQAKADGPTPLVLYFHGGAFTGGDKWTLRPAFLKALLRSGVSVAAINYRYSTMKPFPGPMHDSARALQFLRLHAVEYNIDPTRIASSGTSSGAGISGWLAFHEDLANPSSEDPVERQSTRLSCIALKNAQSSHDPRFIRNLFNSKHIHPALLQLFDLESEKDVDNSKYFRLFEEASPINFVTADDPPAILIYAQSKAPLPPDSPAKGHIHHPDFGFALKEKMEATGLECIVRTREDYSTDSFETTSMKDEIAFLLQHLHVSRNDSAQAQPSKKLPNKNIDRLEKSWVEPDHTEPPHTNYRTFHSATIGKDVSYLIYLPPGYRQETGKRYPVIYWLHGTGGKQSRGGELASKLDADIRDGEAPEMILVSVNGLRGTTLYCDSADGQWPLESVIINDLIPHIDEAYRTIATREARAIEGFSMGGFGAGHLGFKYPELFGTVSILDPAFLTGLDPLDDPHPTWRGQVAYALGGDLDRYQANNPFQLLIKNADILRGRTQIRLVPHAAGNGLVFLSKCEELHVLMDKLGIGHIYDPRSDVRVHNPVILYQAMDDEGFGFYLRAFAGVATNAKDSHTSASEALRFPDLDVSTTFVERRGEVEVYAFSVTSTEPNPATGIKVDAHGYLEKPLGSGPYPAIILNHGLGADGRSWAHIGEAFAKRGIVALQRDFGRGVDSRIRAEMTAEIVEAVQTLPYVDPEALAMYGHSMGSGTTLKYLAAAGSQTRIKVAAYSGGGLSIPTPNGKRYGILRPGDTGNDKALLIQHEASAVSVPLMFYHGAKDDIVPVECSRELDQLLNALGKKHRYTEFEELGHNLLRNETALNRIADDLSRYMFKRLLKKEHSTTGIGIDSSIGKSRSTITDQEPPAIPNPSSERHSA